MDKYYATLAALQALRCGMRDCLDFVASGAGPNPEDEETRTRFVQEYQEKQNIVTTQLRELETYINNLQPLPGPFNLGQTYSLAQEISQERQSLYPQLINSYKWMDKVHAYSSLAYNTLNQNSLRRSYMYCAQKRGRLQFSSCNNPDPDHIDKLFSEINHQNTMYKVCRPFGSNAVVIVTIGRILKAAIVFRGVLIEWVTVRAYDEPLEHDDLWAESRHLIFRKVQDHSHSAMLHFFSPTLPDLAVKSYMTWFNSYGKLFLEPCKRCGKYNLNGIPPTWRDLRTLEPFHEECKNC